MHTKQPTATELSKAIALVYDGNLSPTIVAKGSDETAEEILAIAMEHNVPICNNPALANLLNILEIGDHIPKELYVAVANIIAFAYQIKAFNGSEQPQ